MKKTLILSITLLLTTNLSFAQTDGPSKKETFDFLLEILPKSISLPNNNGAKYQVVDYDYANDMEIYLKYKSTASSRIYFSFVKKVGDIGDLGNVGGNYWYSVSVYFKKQMTYKIRGTSFTDSKHSYYFDNEKNAIRFQKALKHLINLNGKTDSTLFDD